MDEVVEGIDDDAPSDLRLESLGSDLGPSERYERVRLLARGGMADVHLVRDRVLGREMAMKVLRLDGPRAAGMLRRFLDEAELTARLSHPAIVPVVDAGLDAEGRPFFTMQRVEGETLDLILERHRAGEEDWALPRVLEVLLRVCDALAFAHDADIVHRDLKPSNVMVGPFGEVYVMDWGLARGAGPVEGGSDGAPVGGELSAVLTQEGEAVGTAAYMAPEQAAGRRAAIGPRVDGYAVGALLYQLLTGHPPYCEDPDATTAEVLARVRREAPPDAAGIAPHAPPELLAICRKAMARAPERRYATVAELAHDLRQFGQGRVVQAYERGAWAELRKWVGRNPLLAGAMTAIVLVTLGALAWVNLVQRDSARRVRPYALAGVLGSLRGELEGMPGMRLDLVGPLSDWVERAEEFAAVLPQLERELESLRQESLPFDPSSPEELAARAEFEQRLGQQRLKVRGLEYDLQQIVDRPGAGPTSRFAIEKAEEVRAAQAEVAELGARRPERGHWSFSTNTDTELHAALSRVVGLLREFSDPAEGEVARTRARVRKMRELEAGSLERGAEAWGEACSAIADSPVYGGLRLEPQYGLLPLGPDPRTGLWEFAHLASGSAPTRDEGLQLVIGEDSAMVMILVPATTFWIGVWDPSRITSPDQPHDPHAARSEGPPTRVSLDAFFLSKYETTQAQWKRIRGTNPSYYGAGKYMGEKGRTITWLDPVNTVDWYEAETALESTGLRLPTEAQWEAAARAGRNGVDETVPPMDAILRRANHGPLYTMEDPVTRAQHLVVAGHEDGYELIAPIGSFDPNPWGFHDMLGNVSEWTRDNFWTTYERWEFRPGDGLQLSPRGESKTCRGAWFGDSPHTFRVTLRLDINPSDAARTTGVRAARPIDR